MDDLYSILELDNTATNEDIKKAYKRLVLIYHPDKSSLDNSQDKFINLTNAYQILGDPSKRQQYDLLNYTQKINLYDNLKTFVKIKIPNIETYINYMFNEPQLKNYVDDLFSNIVNKLNKPFNQTNPEPELDPELEPELEPELDPETKPETKPEITDFNIYGQLTINMHERYINKYKKIQVNRITKPEAYFTIPILNNQHIIKNEGEYNKNTDTNGDIIITINMQNIHQPTNKYKDFIQLDNNIYYTHYISLYEYLYGGTIILNYLDNKPLNILFDSFVEKFPLITVNNKGMLTNTENDIRGDLFINVKIRDLDNLHNKVMLL